MTFSDTVRGLVVAREIKVDAQTDDVSTSEFLL